MPNGSNIPPCKGTTPGRIAVLVFFVSFFLALALNYIARPLFKLQHPVSYDGYFELAQNMVAGNGYVFQPHGHPVIHRPPLYPLLLTPGALLPPPLWRAYVSALNAALLAGTIALLFGITNRIAGPASARLACLILGFNPTILYPVKTAHPAICQMFLYTAIVSMTLQLWESFKAGGNVPLRRAFLYGALLSATTLIHGTMLAQSLLLLLICAAFSIRHRNSNLAKFTLVTAAASVALLAPWTARNYSVTGRFIPVVGNSGLAYFSGNAHWGITQSAQLPGEHYEQTELRHVGLNSSKPADTLQFRGFIRLADDEFASQQARHHIRSHPAALAKKILLQSIEFYFPCFYYLFPPQSSEQAQYSFLTRLRKMDEKLLISISAINLVLIGTALGGAASLLRMPQSRSSALILIFAWLAFVIPFLPFTVWINHALYTFGTLPILSLFAAIQFTKRSDFFSRDATLV